MGRRSTGGICNWVAGLPCWPFSFKQPTLADTKICDPQLASHTMSHCLMPAACATTLCETVHSSTLPTNRFLAALCSHMPQYYSIQQQMVVPRQKYYLEPSVTTHPSFAQTALVCMALHTARLPARRGNPGCRQTPRSLETPPSTPRYDKCRDHGAPLHALGTRTAGCCCVMQWMFAAAEQHLARRHGDHLAVGEGVLQHLVRPARRAARCRHTGASVQR